MDQSRGKWPVTHSRTTLSLSVPTTSWHPCPSKMPLSVGLETINLSGPKAHHSGL